MNCSGTVLLRTAILAGCVTAYSASAETSAPADPAQVAQAAAADAPAPATDTPAQPTVASTVVEQAQPPVDATALTDTPAAAMPNSAVVTPASAPAVATPAADTSTPAAAPVAPAAPPQVAPPAPAMAEAPKLATFLGQWKLNDGSTTTGVVQVTNSGKDVTMTVVQETRYRVDWTLFGPPFPTNWPLLQGKVDDAGNVTWTYYDTVPGCWVNKAVPVNPTVTADQRRVDFQVATFKAITCQPDDKAPVMGFKLTRQ